MKTSIAVAILGYVSAKTERIDVFSLQEDDMIIRTPQNLDDLQHAGVGETIGDHQNSIFEIDESRPARDHTFFMQDDFKPEDKKVEIKLDKIDTDVTNKDPDHSFVPDQKNKLILVSDNRRPIYGVLSEPLRGDM